MGFDEEELDPHGECDHEIATLRAELEQAKAALAAADRMAADYERVNEAHRRRLALDRPEPAKPVPLTLELYRRARGAMDEGRS